MNSFSRLKAFCGVDRNLRATVFAGVFIIAMLFAVYTQHAWEDYYITYRVSKNAATGHGLVFTPGEKVHVFTSPINVLLPAAMVVVTGNSSDMLVLWLYRVFSAIILGFAAVLLLESGRKNGLGGLAAFGLMALFCFDVKIVDFTINGQEIAFMMFFLALTIYALTVPSRRNAIWLGLAWAGMMWTRPDSCIYFGVIALGFWLFNSGKAIARSRLGLIKLFVFAGVITAVLYLPWFLWAWHYFGSPVPHTIIAKAQVRTVETLQPGALLMNLITFPFSIPLGMTSVEGSFFPIYYTFGGWHWLALLVPQVVAYVCALYWVIPKGQPQARAMSFAFMLSHFYLTHVAPYPAPWYLPTCAVMGIFVFGHMVQHALEATTRLSLKDPVNLKWLPSTVRVAAGTAILGTLLIFFCSAYELRIQQREIETGNRKEIGLWLKQNAASPRDSVFLEPLGYIGFFSQLKMLDIPGLCAPEVVAAEKQINSTSRAKLIPMLKPDWLVLRSGEVAQIQAIAPQLLVDDYSSVKVFDASPRVASHSFLPGRPYLNYDETFIVFKRNPGAFKEAPPIQH